MITQEELFEMAKTKPEIKEAFYKAVGAILDLRKEVAASGTGFFANIRLKKKQLAATFLSMNFASGLVRLDGSKLSEEERELVMQWIVDAANFHELPKEQQRAQLLNNLETLRA
jgi:hypothetical protein